MKNLNKKNLNKVYKQRIREGAITGSITGIIVGVLFSLLTLMSDLGTTYSMDFFFYLPFMLIWFTIIASIAGVTFGAGYTFVSEKIIQQNNKYQNHMKNWMLSWLCFLSLLAFLVSGLQTFWSIRAMLTMTGIVVLASLIGGYIVSRNFPDEVEFL